MTTTETTIGINGMAHVILTVSQFAAARAFYGRLLPALGMTPVCDTDKLFYCVGARTAIGIQPAGPAHDGDRFVQSRVVAFAPNGISFITGSHDDSTAWLWSIDN